jgi:Holliday junction resolvasome RuvABC DNA-binding subunit
MSTTDDTLKTEYAATDTLAVKPKRTLKTTPTPRQRRAARIMADIAMGKRTDIKNQGDIVVEAGYSAATRVIPHKLLDTIGVKEALADIGFNEHTAKKVVEQILSSNEAAHKDRLKAADMVFKVHGTYAAEKHVSLNVEIDSNNERLLELAERLRKHAG